MLAALRASSDPTWASLSRENAFMMVLHGLKACDYGGNFGSALAVGWSAVQKYVGLGMEKIANCEAQDFSGQVAIWRLGFSMYHCWMKVNDLLGGIRI